LRHAPYSVSKHGRSQKNSPELVSLQDDSGNFAAPVTSEIHDFGELKSSDLALKKDTWPISKTPNKSLKGLSKVDQIAAEIASKQYANNQHSNSSPQSSAGEPVTNSFNQPEKDSKYSSNSKKSSSVKRRSPQVVSLDGAQQVGKAEVDDEAVYSGQDAGVTGSPGVGGYDGLDVKGAANFLDGYSDAALAGGSLIDGMYVIKDYRAIV